VIETPTSACIQHRMIVENASEHAHYNCKYRAVCARCPTFVPRRSNLFRCELKVPHERRSSHIHVWLSAICQRRSHIDRVGTTLLQLQQRDGAHSDQQ
jgi:hypothetical protein